MVYVLSVRNGAPPEELRTLAEATGGEIFESGDMPALRGVFKRIDDLQRAKLVDAQNDLARILSAVRLNPLGFARTQSTIGVRAAVHSVVVEALAAMSNRWTSTNIPAVNSSRSACQLGASATISS